MVWQMDDSKFFSENRAKIIVNEATTSGVTASVTSASGRQSDNTTASQTVATNSHGDRLSAERNYYISALNSRNNPDLIAPGGALKGNMYFRTNAQPATVAKNDQQLEEKQNSEDAEADSSQ